MYISGTKNPWDYLRILPFSGVYRLEESGLEETGWQGKMQARVHLGRGDIKEIQAGVTTGWKIVGEGIC